MQKMKGYWKTILAGVLVFAASFSLTELIARPSLAAEEPLGDGLETVSSVEDSEDGGYVLKDYMGSLSVFYGPYQEIPAAITEIETAGLRQRDQELLRQGIHVETREELLQLLEDFGS